MFSGNRSLASNVFRALFVTCVLTALCSLTPALSTAAQVTLAWDANTEPDLAGYKLYYGFSSGSYPFSADVGNVTSYTLSGLLEGRIYYFAAIAYDSSLNESGFSNEVSKAIPNVRPPSVSVTALANGATVLGTAVTVSASASDNVGVAGVQFKVDGVNLGAEVTVAPYAVSWNTALGADGAHTIAAVARDAAGNTATSPAVSVTVDNTPPLISTVSASSVSSAGAIITWATNEASNSQVEYGLTTAYGSATPLNSSLLTAHAVTLTGLLANTPYHYRVKSRDAAGNLANSADFTFTTLMGTVADLTPPAVSMTAPLSGATVSGTVTVSASASDNVGVVGVQFTLDGANLGAEVTTVPYAFSWNTTTATNAAHTLTAVARDLAGNTTTSTAATVTVSNTVAPPSANLVAAYSYNEGSGTTAADASVNRNTATLSGATWNASGKFGSAISFNGTTSYVESPDIDALSPGANATFEAWVFLNSAPTEIASVFNKWSQTVDDEYLFGINPNQTLSFSWQTTGASTWGTPSYNSASGISAIPLNTLTHIAMVRNGATLSFYINGTLDSSLNNVLDTNAFRNGINTLRIGGQGRGARNRFFNGTIDEVGLYNRALSQAEIQSDMNT